MKFAKLLGIAALAIATPFAASAASATLKAAANTLTVKYVFQNNSGSSYNPYSISVTTIPGNTSSCTFVFAGNGNYDEAKLFLNALLAAKALKSSITMYVDTTTCNMQGYDVLPN